VEDETKFLNICLKYETSGIISSEEHRILDYTGHLAVLRFCNLAKVNYWEYVNDFDDTSKMLCFYMLKRCNECVSLHKYLSRYI